MFVDLPLDQLRTYSPHVDEPDDFDVFWAEALRAARSIAGQLDARPITTPIRHSDLFDVTFPGHGGDRVSGWLSLPHDPNGRNILIVEYIGYGGGRGDPLDWLAWSSLGYAHLVMDSRGQGGGWRSASTSDPGDSGQPSSPGFMTRGILDPATYYFTRLFVDAVRILDGIRTHPLLSHMSIVTTGISQGGGLSVAASSLGKERGVIATMPDVPFLAHIRRGAEITPRAPYSELAEYCAVNLGSIDQVFTTTSYIDIVNHAKRASVPALFSVGLHDDITPASTVFAAYNAYTGLKEIDVYPFSGHDATGSFRLRRKLQFLDHLEATA